MNAHTSSSGNPPNRGLLATVVAWYSWLVFRVCKAGLDAAEEWCVGLLRESLQISQRAINGASAWTLSVFNRDYKTQLRGRWTTLQEQYSWWGRAETGRGSTLNAVLARKYDEGGTAEAGVAAEPPAEATAAAAARAAAPAGASGPHDGLRHRRQPASGSQGQPQPQHAAASPSAPQGQPAGISEIEPAEGPEQQAAPLHTQPHLQRHRQPQQGTAGAPSDASAQSQWWGARGAPAWLSDIADEATEAAAAAQEAATAAVQQAATSVSLAVEEAAATAASWARSMRAVFVEPPAGWGAHEAIKQTGLLEDVSLHGQLFISRVFDRLRWLLGKLTFSQVAQTPTAAAAAASAARQQFSMHGSSGSSSRAGQVPGAAPKESAGLFGRRRSPQHPAARAAGAGAGAVVGGAGLQGGSLGAGSRPLKLRSVTSVDLPSTRRASLEAEQSDDEQQRDHAADHSGCSETSSDAYDDAQEDGASSEASCSSTSSWTPQQQHAQAATAAGRVSSAEVAAAPGELADLAGPPLTVRVPHSTLHGGSSSSSRAGHSRVSFAAASGGQGVAAAAALGKDPTPFAIPQVQQQHHTDITALQQQQGPHLQPALAATVSHSSGTGKAHKASSKGSSRGGSSSRSRHKQRPPEGLGAVLPGRGSRRLQRSHSGPAVSALKEVSSAGQVIRMAGYPLEVHEVVTADGYLLRMERIPQPSSTDAVFMMHGVLDTSLTWVAGGITGSQAFAAWDRGFDVWLGTSRSNPPHEAADPARRGSAYWVYSHNEVGMHDMGAQIDHIHAVKMRELTALGRTGSSSRRASSTSESTAARAARRPSGPRSSGTTSSSYAIPEHADILEGVVDADVLVGIQHVRPASAQAAGALASPAGKPAAHAGTAAQAGLDSAQGPAEPGQAGSGPAAAAGVPVDSSSSRSGRAAGGLDMSRAQSAAEIDQAAAAEAAAAFTRHRAALAAAGIGPGSGSMAAAAAVPDQQEQQLGQDGVQSPHAAQGVLLTPTAAAAAAAAARAASALGSAVATAAAAAGGIIGIAASAGATSATDASTDPARAPAESSLPEGAGPQQQQRQASAGPADGRSSSATITAKPAASSGLMERLLGGTVALGEDAAGCGCGSGSGPWGGALQTQGSGLRHVSSAPDVSALAGEQAQLSVGWDAGADASTGKGCEQGEGAGGVAAGARGSSGGGGSGSGGSSRHARRSSCPYFSASPLPDDVVQEPDAGAAHAMNGMQEQPEQQQQPGQPNEAGADQQPLQGASPFSLQQPVLSPTPQLVQQPPQQQQQPQPAQQQSAHDSTAASLPAAAAATAAGPRAASAEPRAVRSSDWGLEPRPYNLRVVCHSLGGLLLLIYCTQRARAGRPHHISRLILLSPAGFHPVIPSMFKPLVYVWRPLMLWTQLVWRQQGFPVQLPTFVARMLAFKLSIDSSKLPAVGDLLRSMARLLLGGDRSAWDRALLMPHYTAAGMPLLSSRQVLHFIQLYLTGRCQLFDYGSEAANVAAYQQRTPPVVSDAYHMLRDVPVHLVAGEHDGVIPASNVRYHYAAMSAAGMDVSYRQFDFGHMDFTFSAKEELGWYVMSLLMRA